MKSIFRTKNSFPFVLLTLFCSNQCFAEGQDGITEIVNFGYSFMVISNILIYTLILGIILKFTLLKINQNIQQINLKAFSISFAISILLTIVFGEKFTFLIFDLL